MNGIKGWVSVAIIVLVLAGSLFLDACLRDVQKNKQMFLQSGQEYMGKGKHQ